MKKPSRLIAVVALLALSLLAVTYSNGLAFAQDKEKPKEKAPAAGVTKWEYRIVLVSPGTARFGGKGGGGGVSKAEEELNKLGEEGFEIAFVTATSESGPGPRGGFPAPGGGGFPGSAKGGEGPLHSVVYYTLKRAKK